MIAAPHHSCLCCKRLQHAVRLSKYATAGTKHTQLLTCTLAQAAASTAAARAAGSSAAASAFPSAVPPALKARFTS